MKVNRGLLHTDATPIAVNTQRPSERAMSKLEALQALPLGSPVWKETAEFFRAVAHRKPADLSGKRIYGEEAERKARYVARVASRAYRGKRLPQGKEWGYLRVALKIVYAELR
jgi:hypothetical protein